MSEQWEELASAVAEATRRLSGAGSLAALDEAAAAALGRRSTLAALQRSLADAPAAERPWRGRMLQEARAGLDASARERRLLLGAAERSRVVESERLDLTEVPASRGVGHASLFTQMQEELEDIFVGLGFVVAEGPEAETEWHNFEALNVPADHPARDAQDSFYLDLEPTGGYLLRTHTSPMQVRLMQAQAPPIWAVVPGTAFRRDTADARHLPMFHQMEALVVDRGVTFGDLAGTVDTFIRGLFGDEVRSRLRPGYFPFTEPSAELDVTCVVCRGTGCRTCAGAGWLELGGCGMVHPAVFAHVGIDPEAWSGFAFGFGVDRLAMVRWGVADVRMLVENDERFLRQL